MAPVPPRSVNRDSRVFLHGRQYASAAHRCQGRVQSRPAGTKNQAIAGSDGYSIASAVRPMASQNQTQHQGDGVRTPRFTYSKTAEAFWTYTNPVRHLDEPSSESRKMPFGRSGDPGTILYWDGRGWMQGAIYDDAQQQSQVPLLGSQRTLCNLYAVWGEKRGEDYDVWAVGENGLVLRRTLGIWHEIPGIQDVLNCV